MGVRFVIKYAIDLYYLYFPIVFLEIGLPMMLIFVNLHLLTNFINAISAEIRDINLINQALLYFLLAQFLYECGWRVRDWIKLQFSAQIQRNVAQDLAKQIIRYDLTFFGQNDYTALVSVSRQISEGVDKVLILFGKIIRYASYVCSAPLQVLSLDQNSGIFSICLVGAWIVAIVIYLNPIVQKVIDLNLIRTKFVSLFSDTLNNIEHVFIYNFYKHEDKKLSTCLNKIMYQDIKVQTVFWSVWVVQGLMFTVLSYLVYNSLLNNPLFVVSTFVAMRAILLGLSDSIWYMSDHIIDFIDYYGRVVNGLNILANDGTPTALAQSAISINTLPQDPAHKYIQFQKVEFQYSKQKPFQFQCAPLLENQMIGLIGHSGSGKTTFIKLLLGMMSPNSGSIFNNIDSDNPNRFTYIPQNIHLFDASLRYNVTYGINRKVNDKEIEACLSQAKCNFIDKLEDGYETIVSKKNISGGQAQRILLARALLMGTQILVLDEPTSSLDSHTEVEIFEYIQTLKATRIIITHDSRLLQKADQILIFQNHRIIDQGTYALLSANPEYDKFFH